MTARWCLSGKDKQGTGSVTRGNSRLTLSEALHFGPERIHGLLQGAPVGGGGRLERQLVRVDPRGRPGDEGGEAESDATMDPTLDPMMA